MKLILLIVVGLLALALINRPIRVKYYPLPVIPLTDDVVHSVGADTDCADWL